MKTLRSLIHFASLAALLFTIFLGAPPLLGQAYQWENFAGSNGGLGDRNATGSAARFYLPNGTVLAPDGNIYVADTSNFTIRRVTPAGVVTTFAGLAGATGHVDAAGSLARFTSPNGIAVDATGILYVSDGATIRTITPGGAVSTLAGTANIPGHVDGGPGVALLFAPSGLAVRPLPGGAAGDVEVYTTDHGFHTIRRITVAGGVATVLTIAGGAGLPGAVDSSVGTLARFSNPTGLALSADGNTLFVADSTNNAIRAVTLTGVFPVNTVAGTPGTFGIEDGVASAARFNGPTAIALDPSGTALAIVDSGNQLVRVMLLSNFQVNTLAGTPLISGSRDASAADLAADRQAKFSFNTATSGTNGATFEANGNLIIGDSFNHTLRRISPVLQVTTLAGRASEAEFGHGVGGGARFSHPAGLAYENNATGRVIVADSWNHVIRGIAPDGTTGLLSGSVGTVGITAAEHYFPGGVGVDAVTGKILVADTYNSRIVRLLPNGTPDVSFGGAAIVGGSGVSNVDGPLAVATFAYPEAVVLDPTNDMIYVADTANHTIRKIDMAAGLVSTIGGSVGAPGSTDGPGPLSRFNGPSSLAVDNAGVIYVSDTTNNLIRRMTPNGSGGFVVDTLAGTGNTFYNDGVGTAASFYLPRGIALDGVGNLFVADSYNGVVRKIVIATATVTTIGGRVPSSGNQGGLGSEATFYGLHGIAVKPDGTVFLSTVYSHGIFIGTPPATLAPLLVQPADNTLTRSPVAVEFTLPEAALPGSVTLSFGANVVTLGASEETPGAHTINVDSVAAGIPDGTYTVTLSYRDAASGPAASDFNVNVTIDTTPPNTTITVAPPANTTSSRAEFTFASNEAGTFEVNLDGAGFVASVNPRVFTGLSDGSHTLEVRAIDAAGNIDPTPATHTWTVDGPNFTSVQQSGSSVPGAGVDARIPSGALWTTFGEPAINDAGQIAYTAAWMRTAGPLLPSSSGKGLFVDSTLVASHLQTVPGHPGAVFNTFTDPVLDEAGRVAFISTIRTLPTLTSAGSVVGTTGRDGSLEVIARTGTVAPGAGGATFKRFASVSIETPTTLVASGSESGILFTAVLEVGSGTPAVTTANDAGVWWLPAGGAGVIKVLREGDPGILPGEVFGGIVSLAGIAGSPGHGRGLVDGQNALIQAKLSGAGSTRNVLLLAQPGTLSVRALTGDLIGGTVEPTATWGTPGLPSFGDGGAKLSASGTIVQGTPAQRVGAVLVSDDAGTHWDPLARIGEPAPGVGGVAVFGGFKAPVNSATDAGVAFIGTIKDGGVVSSNDTAVWWKPNGDPLQLIAREGFAPPIPEIAATRLKSITSLALPGGSTGPLFTVALHVNVGGITGIDDAALIGIDSAGNPQLLAKENLMLLGKTVKSFKVIRMSSGSAGTTRSFNNNGQVALHVTFTNGTQSIVRIDVP